VGAGGAYYNEGTLVVHDSTLARNEARGGEGCNGLPLLGDWPPALFGESTGGAGGQGLGGGVFNAGSNDLVNSTMALNEANGGNGGTGGILNTIGCPRTPGVPGDGLGGGLASHETVTLLNCTVWGNRAQGGGVTNQGGNLCPVTNYLYGGSQGDDVFNSGSFALRNSIIGGPTSSSNCVGGLHDLGHNLCSDASAVFTAPGSHNETDLKLGLLGDHGGPTPTIPLLWGSPAIDAGSDADCPPTDQCGRTRPALSQCDIGAFEFVPDEFRIVSSVLTSSSKRVLRGIGPASQSFHVDASADLSQWQEMGSGTVSSAGWFEVEVASGGALRFYRTASP